MCSTGFPLSASAQQDWQTELEPLFIWWQCWHWSMCQETACSNLTVDIGRAGQPGCRARKYSVDILQMRTSRNLSGRDWVLSLYGKTKLCPRQSQYKIGALWRVKVSEKAKTCAKDVQDAASVCTLEVMLTAEQQCPTKAATGHLVIPCHSTHTMCNSIMICRTPCHISTFLHGRVWDTQFVC